MKTISIGAQSFADLRQKDLFYIDKTDFIREWWESEDPVTLITRPRRFGKTLNMDMLHCFFSTDYEGRNDLFEGLSIWQDEKYRQLQGQFPVIFLSFSDVKQKHFDDAKEIIKQSITNLYSHFYFLREQAGLNPIELRQFDSVNENMSDVTMQTAIRYLSAYLMKMYKKPVIILLDEYDTPLQEAYINGYWDEMNNLIRGLFNATFKSNPYLDRALMTGTTRVSKESIFSDLNNLQVVTTTTCQYETAFGFTENEVDQALSEFSLSDQKEKVRKWYDGFTFGNQSNIYNPWSITNFLKEKRLDTYWTNTSSNSLIAYELRSGSDNVKQEMECLLNGESLTVPLDEQIIFSQLDENEDALWSLFLASGYLRVERYYFDSEMLKYVYRLRITNFEVQLMFRNLIAQWFGQVSSNYNRFTKALVQGDVEAVNYELQEILLSVASSFDTGRFAGGETKPERFYHGLVLGLVATENQYYVRSNRESGLGRYDVAMIPKRHNQPAILMEFKLFDPKKEQSLEETAERAIHQLEDKKYETELLEQNIPQEEILKYGFAFSGKQVVVVKE